MVAARSPFKMAAWGSRLVRLGAPVPALATDLWLLTHPDLRPAARIRAFMDFVAVAAAGLRPRLAGKA